MLVLLKLKYRKTKMKILVLILIMLLSFCARAQGATKNQNESDQYYQLLQLIEKEAPEIKEAIIDIYDKLAEDYDYDYAYKIVKALVTLYFIEYKEAAVEFNGKEEIEITSKVGEYDVKLQVKFEDVDFYITVPLKIKVVKEVSKGFFVYAAGGLSLLDPFVGVGISYCYGPFGVGIQVDYPFDAGITIQYEYLFIGYTLLGKVIYGFKVNF